MANLNTTEVQSRTLTALFDTKDAADRAVRDLEEAGIPREHITQHGGASTTSATTSSASDDGRGFWDSLKDFFMPEEDRYAYAEGVKRGGYLVAVRCDEANYNRVMDILDTEGAVDLDEREANWRSEGWTGYQATGATAAVGAAGFGAAGLGTASMPGAAATERTTTTTQTGTRAGYAASTVGTTGTAATLDVGQDEAIQVYEEQLRVGKRATEHGRVRIRSYIVETPVSEQVSLHSERVEVERRPIDRAVATGEAAFTDRVIEAREYGEEAVVQKDVRVKEEIGLRKVAEERVQTVSDKVRHTEVEIEDERGTVSPTVESTVSSTRSTDRKI